MAIEFLRKLAFLFEPARLKIIYGGRGAGKTEGASTALPVFANHKKLRILCSREFQNSLAQSSYQTLVNCINSASLADTFQIQATRIVSKLTGSEFLFAGLRHNIESIKSLAKIDINWTDEARNISKTSLDKLGPTIRGRHENDPAGMGGPFGLGPELWFTFNPELEDDEIYKRYVIKRQQYAPDFINGEVDLEDQKFYYSVKEKLDNSIDIDYLTALEKQRYQHIRNKRYAFVVKVNHDDNKFFPPDLRREMILIIYMCGKATLNRF
jgi:phage terminase large subunit